MLGNKVQSNKIFYINKDTGCNIMNQSLPIGAYINIPREEDILDVFGGRYKVIKAIHFIQSDGTWVIKVYLREL